jgi:ribonuclease P protein component
MRRRYRLRLNADIQTVRQDGRSSRHRLGVLLFRPNNLPESRFAFVAGRHVGKAVQRNRAKRLMREAVRLHFNEIQNGWDCLFIARRQTVTASLVEVEAAIVQLLRQARILSTSGDGETL